MNCRWFICASILATVLEGSALALTGNVTADFPAGPTVLVSDGPGVGIPSNAPPGTLSGWDIAGLYFHLDLAADELTVGIRCHGIAGDADGDGDASHTSAWLAANNGTDAPGLRSSESLCVGFDFDNNGSLDLIAGNRMFSDDSENHHYQNAVTVQPPLLPFAFDTAQPPLAGAHVYNPAPATPDYEFVIRNVSSLVPDLSALPCFGVVAYGGSFLDDGIGEDVFAPETPVCIVDGGSLPAPHVTISQPETGRVRLDWNAIPWATGYSVRESATTGGPWTEVALVGSPGWLRPEAGPLEARRFFTVVAVR